MCLNVFLETKSHSHCDGSALCEKVAGGEMTSQRPDLECEDTAPPASLTDSQTDRGGEENVVILWRLWFTDPNCSVHAVAHSYVSPRHSELKLREFKVTLMLGF